MVFIVELHKTIFNRLVNMITVKANRTINIENKFMNVSLQNDNNESSMHIDNVLKLKITNGMISVE